MSEQSVDISVEEAKRRLLAWSEQTDAQMHAEVLTAVDHAKHRVSKVLPWVTGAGLVLGLLTGKRRGTRGDGHEHAVGPVGRVFSVVRTAIKVGTFALPLVRGFMASRQQRRG